MTGPVNICRLCGATNYRRVVERDECGVLAVGLRYACSGCGVIFSDPRAWRQGGLRGSNDPIARTSLARSDGEGESAARSRQKDSRTLARSAWSQ